MDEGENIHESAGKQAPPEQKKVLKFMQQESATMRASDEHQRVAVFGAGGSIGAAVCRELIQEFDVVAITRSRLRAESGSADSQIIWRYCDFFSIRPVDAALADVDYAIYLAHTRLPTARLDQAQCEDMDILLADNFARAAKKNNIKQIIYLGGLIPEGNVSSQLLESRNEVIQALAFYGTPVTTIRTGLVVSPGSSAVRLLADLVSPLPFVLIPKWGLTLKQPIALGDVLRAIKHCLANEDTYGQSFDIGGPEVLNFRQILERAAVVLDKKRLMVTLPFCPRLLFKWWVRFLSRKTHPALVKLLIESLQHDMVVKDNPLQDIIAKEALQPSHALTPYLRREGEDIELPSNPRSTSSSKNDKLLRQESRVRSIQRIILPPGKNASWVADQFFQWLPKVGWPFVLCKFDTDQSCNIYNRFPRLRLLNLTFKPDHSSPERRMYFITGGLLAKSTGEPKPRLEFRDVLNSRYTIAAIHDFTPYLPWNFYQNSQAVIHLFAMKVFQKHMAKLADKDDHD